MDGTLSKIGIIDLAERASHLPVNRMVYIYGREDISAGETYGLMVTDAFETRMYLLCYLGHTHCKAVSCDSGMEHTEEISAIRDILESAWMEAELTDFYVDERQWSEKPADITPWLLDIGCASKKSRGGAATLVAPLFKGDESFEVLSEL